MDCGSCSPESLIYILNPGSLVLMSLTSSLYYLPCRIKGYQRGLIVALFSVIAFIIGLAAAIKLSAVVAGYIGNAVKVSDKWLPIISFAVVFLVVVLLVRLGAKFIQKGALNLQCLGWLTGLAGFYYMRYYIF